MKLKKGTELYNKLLGLKRFLTDYYMLSNQEIEKIKLWDDYIIYCIMFDLKGNLDNSVREHYNQLVESNLKNKN